MRKSLLFSLAFLLMASMAFAQDRTISGKVTSIEDGSPVPGVNIVVKGTTTGTVTDIDGNYNLAVPEGASILVFSFIGLETQEVEIGSRSVIDLQMVSDISQLSEVVVTGYSSVKKSNLTSAISTVKAEDIQSQPIGGIDNLLQGKSPGVQVVAQNGEPGSQAYIRIRGIGSVNASNEPLFIVDGVQLTSTQYNAINPNDIKEITILKDAASTSIYGARASNGVVLVTTRNGSEADKPTITYKFQYGQKQMIPNNYDMMNKAEKLRYEVEVGIRTQEDADLIANSLANPETDWFDVLLQNGVVQSHDLSFAGNSDKAKYFFSLGTYDEQGLSVGSQFKRLTVRANTEFDLTDYLKFGNALTVTNSKNNLTRDRNNVQNPFNAIYQYNPYEPEFQLDSNGDFILDADGNKQYNLTRNGFSIGEALRNNPEQERYTNVLGNVFVGINPIEGLNIKSTVGINYRIRESESYVYPGSVLDGYVGDVNAPGSKQDDFDQRFQYNWTNTAVYTFSPADGHTIDALIGTEYIQADIRTMDVNSKGFPSKDFVTHDNASEVTFGSTTRDEWSLWSQFASLSYNLNEKYFATASLRRDGSSRFGNNNKFGMFWSTSAGWNMHEEGFLNNVSFISQLKIRGAVGTSGNLPNGLYTSRGFYGFGSYNNQVSAVPTQLENKDLKWEENFNYSVGIDFGFIQNRISGSLDYYNKNTKDLLFDAPLSRTVGFNSRLENIGEIVNKGFELDLAGDVVRTKDFNVTLFASLATNDNEVLNLNNGGEDIINANSGLTVLSEGQKINTFYLVQYAGVNPANGEELFYDKEGNLTNVWNGDDAVAMEGFSPLPTYFGSFGLDASWKGIRLNASFYYQGGNYTMNWAFNQNAMNDGASYARNNQRVDAFNYWKKPGDTGVLPKPAVTNNPVDTDRYLQRADFIRLRNVNLSYSFPKPWVEKIWLQDIVIYVQGTNLWTFNKYFDGDPEVGRGSDESSLTEMGEVTLYTYPNSRGFTAGINLTF
jgi:TonB-linked SusC/RagA family outer membrane protein